MGLANTILGLETSFKTIHSFYTGSAIEYRLGQQICYLEQHKEQPMLLGDLLFRSDRRE
jgi:hypothetical protein